MSQTVKVKGHQQQSRTSYGCFKQSLRSLRLHEFPCGPGSWRKNSLAKPADESFVVTLKDFGAKHERVEELTRMLDSEEWKSDVSWSNEARQLREMAVLNPWKFESEQTSNSFVHSFIKSLHFRDKNIHEVDKEMLKFSSLEELILTANYLKELNSRNLPFKLQVLELACNQIDSMTSLCRRPPPLQHLGLSRNKLHINEEHKFFSNVYWPQLMSLDVSYNNLTSLLDIMTSISTLENLHSLNLQGNPLSLVAGYRGYIVNLLRDLTFLDDLIVSADEKHYFKGLARRRHLIKEEAVVEISMRGLSGLPTPEEKLNESASNSEPVVATRYYVTYNMLTSDGDVESASHVNRRDVTEVFSTAPVEWGERAVDVGYSHSHEVTRLLALRDFFESGIEFKVVSEVTKTWPQQQQNNGGENSRKKSGKKSASGRRSQRGSRSDEKLAAAADGSNTSSSKKVVGTFHLPTSSLLNAYNNLLASIAHCGGGEVPRDETKLRELVSLQQVEEPKVDKKGAKKGAASVKKGAKGSGKNCESTEENVPEPPLLLDLSVTLKRWTSAADCHK